MATIRCATRALRIAPTVSRPLSTSIHHFIEKPHSNVNASEWAASQKAKSTGPHMTNTNSTIANEMPSIGADKAPPELITSVAPDFVPKDSVPENTERMTGGMQKGGPDGGPNAELEVGEMEGGKFKVEPLRRTGEDAITMRARLLCPFIRYALLAIHHALLHALQLTSFHLDQSRKRGTLESDLLMSTFADANLANMSPKQLEQYDLFLDENDWDIYYWATQEPTPTSRETAEGGDAQASNPVAQGKAMPKSETDEWRKGAPRSGEWAQTVGTFKPAYRPVPKRWQNSEVLAMLRKHVIDRSAGGVHEHLQAKVGGEGLEQSVKGTGGGGLGMKGMPPVKNFDT